MPTYLDALDHKMGGLPLFAHKRVEFRQLLFTHRLRRRLDYRDDLVLVDIGAGRRLSPITRAVLPYVKDAVLVEPNPTRAAELRQTVKIPVLELDATHLAALGPHFRADIIICKHVLQHLPEARADQAWREIEKLTKPGTLVVLYLAESDEEEDEYRFIFPKGHEPYVRQHVTVRDAEKISRADFEKALEHPWPFHGVLTRHYSERSFAKMLAAYHILHQSNDGLYGRALILRRKD